MVSLQAQVRTIDVVPGRQYRIPCKLYDVLPDTTTEKHVEFEKNYRR